MILAGILLTGCGSPGGGVRVGRFLYAANFSVSSIDVFDIDASTGALTAARVSPIGAGTPFALCLTQDGRFLFAPNFQAHSHGRGFDHPGVLAYRIDARTGSATQVPGSPFDSQGEGPTSVAVDPMGRYVFVGNYYPSSTIAAYRIDPTNGRLTPVPGSPFATSVGPWSPVVDPSGRFLYVGNARGLGDPVSVFAIDRETGRLSTIASSPAARDGWAVALAPSGAFLYMTDGGTVSVFGIDRSTGALSAAPVSRQATGGSGGVSIALNADGNALFVGNATSGNVSAYSVDPSSGAVTAAPGSPFSTGIAARSGGYPTSLALDPSSTFLYVWNHDTDNISAYRIDPSTHALTLLPGSPFPGGGDLKILP